MGLISNMKSAVVSSIKNVLLRRLVKKQPVIVKDIESKLLTGKHALITGGNSGIGYAIAKKMLSCGATVTILARNAEKTAYAAQELGCDYIIALKNKLVMIVIPCALATLEKFEKKFQPE